MLEASTQYEYDRTEDGIEFRTMHIKLVTGETAKHFSMYLCKIPETVNKSSKNVSATNDITNDINYLKRSKQRGVQLKQKIAARKTADSLLVYPTFT